MKRMFVATFFLCAVLTIAPTLRSQEPVEKARAYKDGIEVIVNEERIVYSEINENLNRILLTMPQDQEVNNAELVNVVVHQLIRERLLAQLADREQIQIDEKKLDQLIEKKVEEYGGESELVQAVFPLRMLTNEGMTLDDVRGAFIREQKIQAIIERKTLIQSIFVTPKKIKEYYNAHKGEWVLPATAKFREIEIIYAPSENESKPPNCKEFKDDEEAKLFAEEITERIAGGEDFTKIATEESSSPWHKEGGLRKTADKGEWFKKDDLKEFLADFLFAEGRKAGDISGVIQGEEKENGEVSFYILKLEGYNPQRTLSFKEAQEFIKNQIVAEEQYRRREELLKKLYQEAYIYPEEYRKPWTEFSSQ